MFQITVSDYSNINNWLHTPQEISHAADVFYLYPTAYQGSAVDPAAPLICEIDDEDMRREACAVYGGQATVFDGVANIYAPFYRQSDASVTLLMQPQERDAILNGIPKADIFAALDYYFEHYNNGRPFILASHSQGSSMMRFVLAEYMKKYPQR